MFRLLIVDDEPLAVKGVEMGVDWKKYKIGSIFKAYNIRQAKEIFKDNSVDIMLCDIEMPQGSGLELLAWVKDNCPGTVSIIFTCHRDFSYAKEAMHLGSFDYILKPVAFEELEEVVSRAVEKVSVERKMLENSQYGELWRRNQPYIIEQFWMDIINGNIPPNSDDIHNTARERNISMREVEIIPFLFELRRKEDETPDHDNNKLLHELKDILNRMFPEEDFNGIHLKLEAGKVLTLIQYDGNTMDAPEKIEEHCLKVLDMYKRIYGGGLSCYIGVRCMAAGLAKTAADLLEMDRNNVTMKNGLFWLERKTDRHSDMALPNELLSTLLLKEDFAKFLLEVEAFLTGPENEEKIDAAFLKQFHQNLLQIIYSYLNQKNIHVHQNLSDYVSIGLFEKATRSVYDMMLWIKHVVSRIQELRLVDSDTLTVVEKVKKYIAFHIDQNLSREDIANYVYLNPDYLARLFKKETGMTLIEYSLGERMKYARTLLEKTDWGISEIAAHLGYSNFSHFAKAFREKTGMSPGEYKNSCKTVS